MIDQESYDAIQKELIEGRLSEALDLMMEVAGGHDQALREDLLLLKSKYEFNRNQYEIKGVLTDQEFNIHYSKTALGVQEILDRLRQGPNSPAASTTGRKLKFRPVFWLLGLLALILAAWWWWPNMPESPTATLEKVDSTIVSTLPLNDPELNQTTKPITEPETTKSSEKTAAKPPPMSTDVAKEVEELPKPAVKEANQPTVQQEEKTPDPVAVRNFRVNIIRNSDMSDAEIYVDGKRATVLVSTPIITTIRVAEKADMHLFELKKAGENTDCKKELLITQDNQKITFNCN